MIRPEAIFAYDFGNPVQDYSERDAIIYALGLGLDSRRAYVANLDSAAFYDPVTNRLRPKEQLARIAASLPAGTFSTPIARRSPATGRPHTAGSWR